MLPAAFLPSAIVPIATLGFKTIRYYIDSWFRGKVKPVPGSILYCDLWVAVEHSGIYIDDEKISNIEVEGFADSSVRVCGPKDFTSKSVLGKRIYVSCDSSQAVGDQGTADFAENRVGERSFYGLVFKNCHQFSTNCVETAGKRQKGPEITEEIKGRLSRTDWEPTLAALKRAARTYLGASKWRLWDWQSEGDEGPQEPDWGSINEDLCRTPLDETSIEVIRRELAEVEAYDAEISDETIPDSIRQRLTTFRRTLDDISTKYEEVKSFIAACPGAGFSYADLQSLDERFESLAAEMAGNRTILELVKKLGRNHISEEQKRSKKIPEAAQNEVYGIHRSDEVTRLLPAELIHFEDETLEMLFYARLIEKNLLSYELAGVNHKVGEVSESRTMKTGPVVACIDTSGSMNGAPILKAKALLLAVANILKREKRSLHVLLFGASNQIREFSMAEHNDSAGLLQFLKSCFGGGTDFEGPLGRAMEIIENNSKFVKADVLMLTDGKCSISGELSHTIRVKKVASEFTIYSVLCSGNLEKDDFSDEVLCL